VHFFVRFKKKITITKKIYSTCPKKRTNYAHFGFKYFIILKIKMNNLHDARCAAKKKSSSRERRDPESPQSIKLKSLIKTFTKDEITDSTKCFQKSSSLLFKETSPEFDFVSVLNIPDLKILIGKYLDICSFLSLSKVSKQFEIFAGSYMYELDSFFPKDYFTSRCKIIETAIKNDNINFIKWIMHYFNFKQGFFKYNPIENMRFVDLKINDYCPEDLRFLRKEYISNTLYPYTVGTIDEFFLAYASANMLNKFLENNWKFIVDPYCTALFYGNTEALDWLTEKFQTSTTNCPFPIKLSVPLCLNHKFKITDFEDLKILDSWNEFALLGRHVSSFEWFLKNNYDDAIHILKTPKSLASLLSKKHDELVDWLELYYIKTNQINEALYARCFKACLKTNYYPGLMWVLNRSSEKQYNEYIEKILFYISDHPEPSKNDYDCDTLLDWVLTQKIISINNIKLHTADFYGPGGFINILFKHGFKPKFNIHEYSISTDKFSYIKTVFELFPINEQFKGQSYKTISLNVWNRFMDKFQSYLSSFKIHKANEPSELAKISLFEQYASFLYNCNVFVDETLCAYAVKNIQSSACLKLMRLQCLCPWNAETLIAALDNDNDEGFLWAVQNGCPMTYEVALMAKYCNKIDLLEVLVSHGCPWNKKMEEFIFPDPLDSSKCTLLKSFPRTTQYDIEQFIEK
jgi:hypothetical protein